MNVTRQRIETAKALVELTEFLHAHQLPTEDIDIERGNFFIYYADGKLIGTAALERHGSFALLRSVCVSESARKTGIGGYLVADMKVLAKHQLNVSQIYLLTETAPAFFQRHGFVRVTREDVPLEIKSSTEFANVCPASAWVMMLVVT